MPDVLQLPHGVLYPAQTVSFQWGGWMVIGLLALTVASLSALSIYLRQRHFFQCQRQALQTLDSLFNQPNTYSAQDIVYRVNVLMKEVAHHYYGGSVKCLYGDSWRQFLVDTLTTHNPNTHADFFRATAWGVYQDNAAIDLVRTQADVLLWLTHGLPAYHWWKGNVR